MERQKYSCFLNINNYIKSLKNIIQTIRHNDLMKSIFFCQKKSIEICVLLLIMILFSIFLFTLIGSDDQLSLIIVYTNIIFGFVDIIQFLLYKETHNTRKRNAYQIQKLMLDSETNNCAPQRFLNFIMFFFIELRVSAHCINDFLFL